MTKVKVDSISRDRSEDYLQTLVKMFIFIKILVGFLCTFSCCFETLFLWIIQIKYTEALKWLLHRHSLLWPREAVHRERGKDKYGMTAQMQAKYTQAFRVQFLLADKSMLDGETFLTLLTAIVRSKKASYQGKPSDRRNIGYGTKINLEACKSQICGYTKIP